MKRLPLCIAALLSMTALQAPTSAAQEAAQTQEQPPALTGFFERIYQRTLAASPMLQSQQGVNAAQPGWDDGSFAAQKQDLAALWADLHTLRSTFDYRALSDAEKFDYRVLEGELKLRIERHAWSDNLYPLNQIVGLHVTLVGTLINYHPIESVADAQAYIERVKTVGTPLTQMIEQIKMREDKGIYFPMNLIPRLIGGSVQSISGYPFDPEGATDNVIYADFKRKITALSIPQARKDALTAQAKQALLEQFGPAYQTLITTLEAQKPLADNDNGVWQLPDGDAFYAFLIRQFTTTDMTPEDIHQLGLKEVGRIHSEMKGIMDTVGFEGDLSDFFAFLKNDPQFYYPNTDAGRQAYLDETRALMGEMAAKTDEILPYKPASNLVIKRFEAYREASSPGAFYESGSADGTRPGTIYVNLHDMSDVSKVDIEALMFHEGIPGHHMQYSLINSLPDIPKMRTYEIWWSNTALTEGWALYAESYARELGFYEDPYSDFGRLSGELWRACRLVVDSGLHYKRWSRDEAVAYLDDNTASTKSANIRAVDRYLAVPGQATAFKVGMNRILDVRAKAREMLGDDFDIRGFHFAVLKHGSISLTAMEQSVMMWVEDVKAGR